MGRSSYLDQWDDSSYRGTYSIIISRSFPCYCLPSAHVMVVRSMVLRSYAAVPFDQSGSEASGIMLSLNSSVLQLAMAAGAGIGGIIVEKASLSSISWIGAAGVAVAAGTAVASLGLSRSHSRRKALQQSLLKAEAQKLA